MQPSKSSDKLQILVDLATNINNKVKSIGELSLTWSRKVVGGEEVMLVPEVKIKNLVLKD